MNGIKLAAAAVLCFDPTAAGVNVLWDDALEAYPLDRDQLKRSLDLCVRESLITQAQVDAILSLPGTHYCVIAGVGTGEDTGRVIVMTIPRPGCTLN